MSRAKRNSLVLWVVAAVVALGAGWLLWNRQFVQDWMVVRQYDVSSEVAGIAERAAMSDQGRFLFYASEPQISDAAEFNDQCGRKELAAAILGCYSQGRIFLYRVDHSELDGIEEVTAAHEMLHAAWDRTSQGERERLGGLLEDVYARVKTPELEERMAYYERQQPGERINELHSIIGTEIDDIGQDLERHYEKYFDNRHSTVRLHDIYAAVFTQLKDKANALKKELDEMAPALEADIAAYNSAVTQLNQDITVHNERAASVNRQSSAAVNAYNARRAALMAQHEQLQRQRETLDGRKVQYNQKIEEYNALVLRSTTLTNSIDSLKLQKGVNEQ